MSQLLGGTGAKSLDSKAELRCQVPDEAWLWLWVLLFPTALQTNMNPTRNLVHQKDMPVPCVCWVSRGVLPLCMRSESRQVQLLQVGPAIRRRNGFDVAGALADRPPGAFGKLKVLTQAAKPNPAGGRLVGKSQVGP